MKISENTVLVYIDQIFASYCEKTYVVIKVQI
jgi:hypothetical protein